MEDVIVYIALDDYRHNSTFLCLQILLLPSVTSGGYE